MKMSSAMQYELKAECFRIMTGHAAPGKDAAAAEYPSPFKERQAAWIAWQNQHGGAAIAMIMAVEKIILDK